MTERVRLYLRVPGTEPMPQLMSLIQGIEAAGFDGVGILDSQLLSRDTYIVLAQAATHTSTLTLFPAVSNPFTRHPSVLASAIATVEEMAPGRVKFVFGTGYTSASTIGRKPATLAEMRACITQMRSLLQGREADWNGKPGRLAFASKRPIPVIMAATGPKAIELAGEVADGVLLMVGFNQSIMEAALSMLERGAQRGGRTLDDLEIIWGVRTGIAATTAEARRQARPIAVHWGVMEPNQWLAPAGLALPHYDIPQATKQIYPDLMHASNWEEAIAATSFVGDDEVAKLCDALGLFGTPEDCARRIVEVAKLGVRSMYLLPSKTFGAPDEEIAAFRDVVIPYLAKAGLR